LDVYHLDMLYGYYGVTSLSDFILFYDY